MGTKTVHNEGGIRMTIRTDMMLMKVKVNTQTVTGKGVERMNIRDMTNTQKNTTILLLLGRRTAYAANNGVVIGKAAVAEIVTSFGGSSGVRIWGRGCCLYDAILENGGLHSRLS